MEELERRKAILKLIHCYKSPVRLSFVYLYYHTYAQDTDVHTYIINSKIDNLFTEEELQLLMNEKKPIKWSFKLILKILKLCCTPTLSSAEDTIWSDESIDSHQNGISSYRIEMILNHLSRMYKEFLHKAHSISVDEIENEITDLEDFVVLLVEKSADFVSKERWNEEKDKLSNIFLNIRKGDLVTHHQSIISEVVKGEIEFRGDLYEELLSEELKKCGEFSWHLQTFSCDQKGFVQIDEFEDCEEVEAKSIVEIISESGKRICWISGEHGIGKSSFGAAIATASSSNLNEVPGLQKYSAVIVISLLELQNAKFEDENNILRLILPLTSQIVSKEYLSKWLQDENILVIFDDVNKHSDKIIEQMHALNDDFPNVTSWFMGRLSSLLKYIKQPHYAVRGICFELKGLEEENIFSLSELVGTKYNNETLSSKIKANMNRLAPILKYPTIFSWTCQLWSECPKNFNEVYSASDLMWQILAWNVRKLININIKNRGKMRKKFLRWIKLAGELALYSLKADHRLDKVLMNDLALEIANLFSENAKRILEFMFKPVIAHCFAGCYSAPASTCKPFLEYLSSWYFVDELLRDRPLNQMTEGLVNVLPLILFAAGHMERFQDEGSVTIPEERKVIKALVNYKPNSYDDFSFIQRFVAEMRCIKRIVQIVIDETEYNEEWNINISDVQQKSLQVLLSFVSPNRLIFLANDSRKNYELPSVMSYICRVEISVWIDSIPQFSYGVKQKTDSLIKPFLDKDVIPKLDLFSGNLSSSAMQELIKFPATRHLVLLRLKVNSEKLLRTALSLPKDLPNLLWLEIKIDMCVRDIKIAHIRPTDVPLFDVYVRNLEDADVTFVADLLTAMQKRFTGIHLEETNLTPEGVYTLLKELGKRKVSLRGLEEDIVKFRRWYYCCLTNIPKEQVLTEKDCIDIIDHDDRGFFSDHYVSSSRFVTSIEAWNLRSYLESQPNIIKFLYESSNIIFTKSLDGDVEINFKGVYKDSIEDKVMNGKDPSLREEIHKQVLAFY